MPSLNEALKRFSEFLQKLVLAPSNDPVDKPPDIVLSGEVGGVALWGKEAAEYQLQVQKLITALRTLSPETVREAAKTCTLDVVNANSAAPRARTVQAAIARFRAVVTQPETAWTILLPIQGLAPDALRRFGRLRFLKPRGNRFRAIRARVLGLTRGGLTGARGNVQVMAFLEKHFASLERAGTVGSVTVAAIDEPTAYRRALALASRHLDVIAFFADMASPMAPRIAVSPPGGDSIAFFLLQSAAEEFSMRTAVIDRPFITKRELHRTKSLRSGLIRAGRLLREEVASTYVQRVLTAISWAGRATGMASPVGAFIQYCVALESFLLGNGSKTDLTYRLRVRGAMLLGRTLDARSHFFDVLGGLYTLRSAIVHAGVDDVSEFDLRRVTRISQGVLLRALLQRPFSTMKTNEDLELWFEKAVLR